jgi:uncharacterized cupredoxin-like copper-binding protein
MISTRSAIRTLSALTAIAAFAAVGVGCGGSSNSKTPTPAQVAATATKAPDPTTGPAPTESETEQTVAVSLSEWKITGPAGAALGPLKAGEIKFDVHNDGTTQHEFVVIKTDADVASLPIEESKVNEEAAGESPGEADDIDPAQAKDATMRLEPGKYVFICNVPGHYQSGMRGQLIVQ